MLPKSPLEAYQTIEKNIISGRETEARVLTKAALKLKKCQDCWDQDENQALLDEALKFNQRVWGILQGELAQDDNPLPKELRHDLIKLSTFINRRILETMAKPVPSKLNIIIDINNNIAAGLRKSQSMKTI